MYFSKSNIGFYREDVHGEIGSPGCKIPADAVAIPSDLHAALLAGQAAGRIIAADADGFPVLIDRPPKSAEQIATDARNVAKTARAAAVEAIVVTTAAGNTFDGDEVSQGRMVRAIVALQATGVPSVNWVLADNRVIQATAAELSEALALAGAAQAAIWGIA